jgi:hypothetical protein
MWSHASTPPYIYLVRYLVKHQETTPFMLTKGPLVFPTRLQYFLFSSSSSIVRNRGVQCFFFFSLNSYWLGILILYSSTLFQELILPSLLWLPLIRIPTGWHLSANFSDLSSCIFSTCYYQFFGMSEFLLLCFLLLIFPSYRHLFDGLILYNLVMVTILINLNLIMVVITKYKVKVSW